MRTRLQAIARRRAELAGEIGRQRAALGESLAEVRQAVAFAGAGLVISRVLARRPWLRALALGALAVVAARRLAVRPAIAGDSRPDARPARAGNP